MTFISLLSDDSGYQVLSHHGKDEWIHSVPLGHVVETDMQINAVIHIMRDPPDDPHSKRMELMFMIGALDAAGRKTSTLDGRETKAYLQGEDRNTALRVICSETYRLLQIAKPDVVTMSTAQKGPPEKALVKYGALNAAILSAGYKGGPADSYDGDHIWMFVKST